MVKIPGKRFQAPEKNKATKIKRDRNASRVVNKAHLKTGLSASHAAAHSSPRLRKGSSSYMYGDLVNMPDMQARKVLRAAGVLPERTDRICCWQCGSRMQSASSSSTGDGKDVVQCPDCVLPGRHRVQLRHASLSWSVFWSGATKGHELTVFGNMGGLGRNFLKNRVLKASHSPIS